MSISLSNDPIKSISNDKASLSIAFKVLVLLVFLLSVIIVFGIMFTNNLWTKYHESDRITYVKLDPKGNWTIERTNRQMDDFYQATVDSSISRLLTKCLSNVPATIQNDWAVCASFLSSEKLKDFYKNRFISEKGFDAYIEKHATCHSCDYVKFKVKDIDHKNNIPTSFTDVYGHSVQIYESIVYGDFVSTNGIHTSVVVDLKWSFVSDDSKRQFGELLIENPLGIYFIDYVEVEDI